MPDVIPADSVGIVTPQIAQFDTPLALSCGQTLSSYQLIYETYGTLNQSASNAILICHALSGDHHAAGYHAMSDTKTGWWDTAIGPGKAIDTDKFFVIALNNLGGCCGSTGPTSINPETGQRWEASFPIVTVEDWVESQARLADLLGIQTFAAIVGGSLGGMQVLEWSIRFPTRLKSAVIVASAPKLSTQNIAFNEVARQSIRRDPDFFDGNYIDNNSVPTNGLGLARMLGHITYLSDDAMGAKFGRQMRHDSYQYNYGIEFEVESYLRYQGEAFTKRFDANTYMLMTKALDYFDPASQTNGDLSAVLSRAQCEFLLVSFTTDWRFSPERSEEIVNALVKAGKQVSYAKIEAAEGHDAFLFPIPRYMAVLNTFLTRVANSLTTEVK
ncbi:homoserine O-succinyltransferase MetX [Marinomonas polaris]|jgi:homoserine O-acetyltransferase/O-succinyltransferase|uniref:Homoserine O-succinyltransferase n=1 Tax=Marinomonas polaris DSM 16579 TaxID=1122206 RepID=A0A1M5B9Y2_9GAMM|nr:homoserine O-acetyltransferase [Marinomonas polaris]MBU2023385.1 homoserine O-acetyltransferase [Gammaproteobacteria bacterium]MBU2240125.1 homoserine O-acetyltransferase [Gammaproteobacteria bacterium]SHF39258.1 homoserine O-acetyltransferase [Marinomonas polaris DSM 16579]|tara:strand:+ start:35324 stop:36481 length:1158 start_codon:yes stop_codon:yes gene_type:complete